MKEIISILEHTILKPTVNGADIDQIVRECKEFGFYGVCVPPFWVKRARREGGSSLKVVTVAGFPLGYNMTETKLEEIKTAIKDGTDEIDLVINISAFKSQMEWGKVEVAKCAKLIHEQEKILKVIIETAYFGEEEIVDISRKCADAGADFIKTSTGFASSGAKAEIIELIRKNIPGNVGIKASGGIKTLEDAIKMQKAGADRIGSSTCVQIFNETLAL